MQYERIIYPDGQISAKLISDSLDFVEIRERINSYEDLIFVRSIADACPNPLHLFIPCLFGQRSDRRFSEHQSFDLKVIADIINSCNFVGVEVFDPHSDVALALINNSKRLPSDEYVGRALGNIKKLNKEENGLNVTLISPDAGAFKKVFGLGNKFSSEVIGANKHRDLKGDIHLTFAGDVKDKVCLIVDDLLDGGYTFVVLGKKLKELGAKKVYLYVSHAYFHQGTPLLQEALDGIYCTNSVKSFADNRFIVQYKII